MINNLLFLNSEKNQFLGIWILMLIIQLCLFSGCTKNNSHGINEANSLLEKWTHIGNEFEKLNSQITKQEKSVRSAKQSLADYKIRKKMLKSEIKNPEINPEQITEKSIEKFKPTELDSLLGRFQFYFTQIKDLKEDFLDQENEYDRHRNRFNNIYQKAVNGSYQGNELKKLVQNSELHINNIETYLIKTKKKEKKLTHEFNVTCQEIIYREHDLSSLRSSFIPEDNTY